MHRRTQVLAIIGAAALALAGCGGDDGDDGGGGSSSPIVVGAHVPLTGPLAGNGKALRESYEFAVDQVNAKGGVDGRKIELVVEDDQGDPATATNVVRKLAAEDKATAILGTYGSAPALAGSAQAERYRVPNVQPFASAPEMVSRGLKYLFNTFRLSTQIEPVTAEFMLEVVKPRNAAIVFVDNPFAIAGAETLKKLLEEGGVSIDAYEKVQTAQPNYTPVVGRIKAAKPDAILMVVYPPDDPVFMKQFKQFDVVPRAIYFESSTHLDPAVTQALGKDADWALASPDWYPDGPFPKAEAMVESFEEEGRKARIESVKGYQAAEILLDALLRSKGEGGEQLRDAISATDIDGVIGRVKFLPNGQIVIPTTIAQLQDMKPVAVWPEDVKQADWVPFKPWSQR